MVTAEMIVPPTLETLGDAGGFEPATAERLLAAEHFREVSVSPSGDWLVWVIGSYRPNEPSEVRGVDLRVKGAFDGKSVSICSLLHPRLFWAVESDDLVIVGADGENLDCYKWAPGSSAIRLDLATCPPAHTVLDWLANGQLLLSIPTANAEVKLPHRKRQQARQIEGWRAQELGIEHTADVLDTDELGQRRHERRSTTLTLMSAGGELELDVSRRYTQITISPNKRHILALFQLTPECDEVVDMHLWQRPGEQPPIVGSNILNGTAMWSPDSRFVAGLQSVGSFAQIVVVELASGAVHSLGSGRVELGANNRPDRHGHFTWLGNSTLLVSDPVPTSAESSNVQFEWRVRFPTNVEVCVEQPMDPEVRPLPLGADGGSAWCIDGDVVVFNPLGAVEARIEGGEWKFRHIYHPGGNAKSHFLLAHAQNKDQSVAAGDMHAELLINATDRTLIRVAPHQGVYHFEVSATAKACGARLVLQDHGPAGNQIWLWRQDGAISITQANKFLSSIAAGREEDFTYGSSLSGRILLPPSIFGDGPYPAIVYVYPGQKQHPGAAGLNIRGGGFMNLQLLAGMGFAVLVPELPMTGDISSQPYAGLMRTIDPAIEFAAQQKWIDKDRLGIMGYSAGGGTAMSVISQTDVFKAAIAIAGVANRVSRFGSLPADIRFDECINEHHWGDAAPPYADIIQYYANSPITYAHRINTPLLIIQGDFDHTGLQQGEEIFSALRWNKKRARFVRFFGEGHHIDSPANVVEMWSQIESWLKIVVSKHDGLPSSDTDEEKTPAPSLGDETDQAILKVISDSSSLGKSVDIGFDDQLALIGITSLDLVNIILDVEDIVGFTVPQDKLTVSNLRSARSIIGLLASLREVQ